MTKDIASIYHQIASAEAECPEHYIRACATDGPVRACSVECRTCKGKGTIPRFPWARIVCQQCFGHPGISRTVENAPCKPCKGTGYTVAPGLEWLMLKELWDNIALRKRNASPKYIVFRYTTFYEPIGEGDTQEEAIFAAFHAVFLVKGA